MKHEIKTVNPFFSNALAGKKNWELRKNDRGYKVGDYIISKEYSPELDKYSGRLMIGEIIDILENYTGLENGYCILTINYEEKK